eukprot:TRINITY_DN21213_c0_g1_i1.p1 TRINITY_DN21213_c0_g1~~TRINITY_DN21213_c0_g1_i1.p1  ORF type:complete len:192 (+),score=19.85 TRINITY_DN21213_c0_g1_i1:58-633(+)
MGQAHLSGGWKPGDTAFFAAPSQTLPSGDKLEYGARCEVVGPSEVCDGNDHQRVAVQFPEHSGPVACYSAALSPGPPDSKLPNGFVIGEVLVYRGKSISFGDGNRVARDSQGIVAGPSDTEHGVAILFPGMSVPIVTTNVERPLNENCCFFPFCSSTRSKENVDIIGSTMEVHSKACHDSVIIAAQGAKEK